MSHGVLLTVHFSGSTMNVSNTIAFCKSLNQNENIEIYFGARKEKQINRNKSFTTGMD